MSNLFAPSLQGDGVRFTFFDYLWNKNRGENKDIVSKANKTRAGAFSSSTQIRVPDTVIFRLGQPLQWYFTKERGGETSILRKRKKNVNVEKIEEVFLKKILSTNKGCLDPKNDIVAYFISSKECSSLNRQGSFGVRTTNEDISESKVDPACNNTCDIEYFNKEGLHKFLFEGRKSQTGILQLFIRPAGGGTHNSQIRAICAPKMCVLERRKTKQELHDSRFGLYERAVTFEGPEVYSTSLPIRGAALPDQLRELCSKVLKDVSEAAMKVERASDPKEDKRMVLNLKVDSKNRIWLLYSSSIRSLSGGSKFNSEDFPSNDNAQPLNIQNVIKLSPSIKLSQNANHDPSVTVSNKRTFDTCPSCAKIEVGENFHPIPYKTIISHFEQVKRSSRNSSCWPPHEDIIKSSGGVGFGTVAGKHIGTISKEDIEIPPIIRHLHERLKIDGYRRYRSDPLFLHRKCEVCESCFLAYAKLVSTSFQITQPIQMDTELPSLGFHASHGKEETNRAFVRTSSNCKNIARKKHTKVKLSSNDLFIQGPSLPAAIIDPPSIDLESDNKKFMPLPYEVIESRNQPLMHMLNLHQKLDQNRTKSKKAKTKNPYAIPMKFVDDTNCSKVKKQKDGNDIIKKSIANTFDKSNEKMLNEQHLNEDNVDDFGVGLLLTAAAKLRNDGIR